MPRKLGLSNALTIQSKPESRPHLAKPRKMLTLPRQHTESRLNISDFSQINPWFNPPSLKVLIHIAMLVPQGLSMPTDDVCNFLMYRLPPCRMAFTSASGLCWDLTFFCVLGIELGTLGMLCIHSTTELYPQSPGYNLYYEVRFWVLRRINIRLWDIWPKWRVIQSMEGQSP